MSQSKPPFATFEAFWPWYLQQHRNPLNRWLHIAGTLALLPVLWLALRHSPWWWLALPVTGYGPAWIGHFLVERNRPATFRHPFWSLRADFRMCFLCLTGRTDALSTTPATAGLPGQSGPTDAR